MPGHVPGTPAHPSRPHRSHSSPSPPSLPSLPSSCPPVPVERAEYQSGPAAARTFSPTRSVARVRPLAASPACAHSPRRPRAPTRRVARVRPLAALPVCAHSPRCPCAPTRRARARPGRDRARPHAPSGRPSGEWAESGLDQACSPTIAPTRVPRPFLHISPPSTWIHTGGPPRPRRAGAVPAWTACLRRPRFPRLCAGRRSVCAARSTWVCRAADSTPGTSAGPSTASDARPSPGHRTNSPGHSHRGCAAIRSSATPLPPCCSASPCLDDSSATHAST